MQSKSFQTNCYALNLLGQEHCGVIHPPTSFTFPPDRQEFLLPLLLIWHPARTYTHIFENQSLECPQETCNKKSVLKGWNDGHAAHCMPRTIHDVNDVVLLVSAIIFVDLCTSMCHNGMNFHSLEAVIGKTRWHYHIGRKQKYESIVQQFQKKYIAGVFCEWPVVENFVDFDSKTVPSDDLLANVSFLNF